MLKQVDVNVIEVRGKAGPRVPFEVYCLSDVHHDSIKCDISLFRKHLEHASNSHSKLVLIAGDLFDAMQGRDDPRRSLEELRAEYKREHYLDLIVSDLVKTLSDFPSLTYILGKGNHETSVQRKNGTDLIGRVVELLNAGGISALAAGYWGFLSLKLLGSDNSTVRQKNLYWHHGLSTSAPVTRGIIETAREGTYLPDADVVVNGHNHQQYITSVPRLRLNRKGRTYRDYQKFLRTPGYKTAGLFANSQTGFDVERHPAPTPLGCIRVDWYFDPTKKDIWPDPREMLG